MHINIDHDAPSALILGTDRRNAAIYTYRSVRLHSPKSSHLAASSSCSLFLDRFHSFALVLNPNRNASTWFRESIAFHDMSNAHARKLCEKKNKPTNARARETSKPTNTFDPNVLFHYLCRNDVLHSVHFAFICRMMYRHVYFINIHIHTHTERE